MTELTKTERIYPLKLITFGTDFGFAAVDVSEILKIELILTEVSIFFKNESRMDVKVKDEEDKNRWIEIIKNLGKCRTT